MTTSRAALAILALFTGCGSVRSLGQSEPESDAPVADAPVADAPVADAPVASLDAAVDASPDAGPVPTGLVVEAPIQWSAGSVPVALGAITHRFCFLQSVAGMFKDPAHEIVVAVVGANWLLSGTGQVSAFTRCVTFSAASGIAMTQQFDWRQGDAPVDMGPVGDRVCALTRMAGTFNGGGELVHAETANDRWRLRGTSAATGVSASARCLVFPPDTAVVVGGEVNWAQGDAAALLAPIDHHVCVMTLIVGSFLGGGERVSVEASGTSWILTGSSGQQGVAVRARCPSWP